MNIVARTAILATASALLLGGAGCNSNKKKIKQFKAYERASMPIVNSGFRQYRMLGGWLSRYRKPAHRSYHKQIDTRLTNFKTLRERLKAVKPGNKELKKFKRTICGCWRRSRTSTKRCATSSSGERRRARPSACTSSSGSTATSTATTTRCAAPTPRSTRCARCASNAKAPPQAPQAPRLARPKPISPRARQPQSSPGWCRTRLTPTRARVRGALRPLSARLRVRR